MKTVRIAYHTLCQKCATDKGVCGKCQVNGMSHPYVVLGSEAKKDEEMEALSKMTERQRRTYLRELEKEERGRSGKKTSNAADEDSFSEGGDSDDDGLGEMPNPPPRKFDPDMLVKERALCDGKASEEAEGGSEEEDGPAHVDDDGEDAIDGSGESFEEDSDEIDRVDEDAKKLAFRKRDPNALSADEDESGAGGHLSDAGSEDEN